jgi:dihydrofolate reductase
MANLFSFNMVTLDGFFEGPEPWSIDWHNAGDEEFDDFAVQQLQSVGTLLLGRATYQGFASYWPSPAALESDPVIAEAMNSVPKIVFSRTLEMADWNNTRLIRNNVGDKIASLKQRSERDLAIFGSANLMSALLKLNLVDEHRVMINPVILGRGTPLFQGLDEPLKLKLVNTRMFRSGNVLLTYQPASP